MYTSRFDPDLADRITRAQVRYTLDAAHNRRRFERDGIVIAIGNREPRILPVESRLPIVVRPGFHPDERRIPDCVEIAASAAWAWLRERCITFDRWLWGKRGRRFVRRAAYAAAGTVAFVIFLHRI
jgi:hypothetical protein